MNERMQGGLQPTFTTLPTHYGGSLWGLSVQTPRSSLAVGLEWKHPGWVDRAWQPETALSCPVSPTTVLCMLPPRAAAGQPESAEVDGIHTLEAILVPHCASDLTIQYLPPPLGVQKCPQRRQAGRGPGASVVRMKTETKF